MGFPDPHSRGNREVALATHEKMCSWKFSLLLLLLLVSGVGVGAIGAVVGIVVAAVAVGVAGVVVLVEHYKAATTAGMNRHKSCYPCYGR